MKFLHAADLHLDSPLHGLERYEGAPVDAIRTATRRALIRLVDLALEEQVDFMVIAGDLYDRDWRDYHTPLFFARQMERLREPGIRVVMISGNHDAASILTRRLSLPPHVRLLSDREPETVRWDDLGVAIHGQGFTARQVTGDLSRQYPAALPGHFNLGLLHTSATGRPGHETYAPCTVEGLLAKGYDYWALGHVHTREVLHRDPWIVFPGNLQGRHLRETGPKGALLVTVENGRVKGVAFRETDVLRWGVCLIEAGCADDADGMLASVREAFLRERTLAEGLPLALRVRLVGPCAAHPELCASPERWRAEIQSLANAVGGIWVEKVSFETSHLSNLAEVLGRDGPLAQLIRGLHAMELEPALLDELLPVLDDLKRKLPSELKSDDQLLALATPEQRRACLEEVRQLLLPRLLAIPEA